MKPHPAPYACFTFITTIALALLMHVNWAASAESADTPPVTTNDGFPTQVFRFHIGKCHFDPKEVSWFSGGRPEVRIAYRRGGLDKTWTSASTHPDAKGLDFSFKADVDLPLDLDPNAQIHILLIDVGRVWNNTFIDKSFPALKVREDLARGRLTANLSSIELGIADPKGRYEVQLERTFVSPQDFEAIGGTLPKELQDIKGENWLLSPLDSAKRQAANWLQSVKEHINKCDNLVIVEQNGKTIFDSSKVSTPQGLAVAWDARFKFAINWKPDDKITIHFQNHNTLGPNSTILEHSDNSDSSISLLEGPTHGGKHGQSIVLFSTRHLEG
jgi:hypothetical protein